MTGNSVAAGALAAFGLEAEDRHHLLQIFPHFTFGGGVTQQVGGVIRGNQFGAAEIEPFAAEARNSLAGLQQRLRRAGTEAADHFRLNYGELAHQERRTGFNFIFFRQAIFGRAALHHVRDVNVFAAQAHRFDHLREQLPGAPDERLALRVFVATRAFADENQVRLGISHAEDDFRAAFMQFAASAIWADIRANAFEGVSLDALVE